MKAIVTRYLNTTATKPTRIVASDSDGNRIVASAYRSSLTAGLDPLPAGLNEEERHRRVAELLCDKMGWSGAESLVCGSIKGGFVFVFPPALTSVKTPEEFARDYYQGDLVEPESVNLADLVRARDALVREEAFQMMRTAQAASPEHLTHLVLAVLADGSYWCNRPRPTCCTRCRRFYDQQVMTESRAAR